VRKSRVRKNFCFLFSGGMPFSVILRCCNMVIPHLRLLCGIET
jgi:hypothetical protein